MRWFIYCISCVLLTGCTAASVDTATGSDSSRSRKPDRAASNAALPLLETDEVKARAQVALDIEAQPSEVQRRYYTALLAAFDRSIALEDEQLANLEQGTQDGLSPRDTEQVRTSAMAQRTRWLEQRGAAAAALARLKPGK